MIIGTAGHIDHGKTALVKALTGVDADRLEEEKLRGITIDLGFAYKPLANGEVLGFVDVPGHERFIHNMLAGATGIAYVMLVVAADDGPMPQTREHLQILSLLGLSRGVVALTKSDLVSAEQIGEVRAEIQALLKNTPLASARIIPVSSVSCEGVAELDQHLVAAARATPASTPRGHFRLAVDRSFTLQGVGVVVTGTVFSGEVKPNDKLVISPAKTPVRVRGIHAQNRASQRGRAGQRCALNLAGVEKSDVRRGDWLLAPEIHAPTSRFDARLTLLSDEEQPLAHWTPVHVHLGAANVPGRVALLESEVLHPGSTMFAQLVIDEAIGALHGDRFIIRDQSASRTLGGGFVLDPFALERGRRKPERLRILLALSRDTAELALHELLALTPAGVDLDRFALAWNLTPAELEPLSGKLVRVRGREKTLVFSRERWSELRAIFVDALRRKRAAVSPDELRTEISVAKTTFTSLLDDLLAEKQIVRDGALLRVPEHDAGLSEEEESCWRRIESVLKDATLQPPRIAELSTQLKIEESKLRALIKRLVRKKMLRQVSEEVCFLPETLAEIADKTEALARANADGVFTVAQFRTASGLSRNLAVPMLEAFDRWGFTLRVGEGRKVRRSWLEIRSI